MAKYTKRRDKRGYEWKSAYREKEALMLERGYPEVSPHAVSYTHLDVYKRQVLMISIESCFRLVVCSKSRGTEKVIL